MSKPERLFPLRTLTPELVTKLRCGAIRRCNSMHECCLCDRPIALGETYLDAGIKFRAHWEHLNQGHTAECLRREG